MKKSNLFIILVLFLAGCTSETPVSRETVALKLAATQSNVVVKSTDPAFTEGISTGLYVTAKDASVTASYFSNRKYTSIASGELLTDANIDLTIGQSYDIYAYAPYKEGISAPSTIEFSHGTDVLWAPKSVLSDVSKDNHIATLNFEHRSAQISFNVVFSDDFNPALKFFSSESVLTVSGFYDKGNLDITTGLFVPSGSANIGLKTSGQGQSGAMALATAETCFIPASGNMSLKVNVLHAGKNYNGEVKETFLPGHSYRYTVTISPSDVALGITGMLKDWIPVSADLIMR